MNIKTENDRAYVVQCGCGHVFEDDGRHTTVSCDVCFHEEDTMALVGRWWATAGWAENEIAVLAPAIKSRPGFERLRRAPRAYLPPVARAV